jgi:hypothetical protein
MDNIAECQWCGKPVLSECLTPAAHRRLYEQRETTWRERATASAVLTPDVEVTGALPPF